MLNQPPASDSFSGPTDESDVRPLDLAVILPTFNERGNVEPVIAELDRVLAGLSWEAIFVDDASPDGTAAFIREIGKRDRRVRVIERIGRRGLGSACIEGMLATAAPAVAVMDADLQHDSAILPDMLALLQKGQHDLVVGSRFVKGGSTGNWDEKRLAKSKFATRITSALLPSNINDPMSGFFMMRTDTLIGLAPKLAGIGFKILLDIITAGKGTLRIAELPYTFRTRTVGESKLDHVVALELLIAVYDRRLGKIIPARFAMFGAIGGLGVALHMAILAMLYPGTMPFIAAHGTATVATMTFNFYLNNVLTYSDRRLTGFWPLLRGWFSFCLVCGAGAIANIGVAAVVLNTHQAAWTGAALIGIAVGAVWNFVLSSRFTWGRY